MKQHIPVQLILDADRARSLPTDFAVQAAFKHAVTKVAIKNVGPRLKGDTTKFVSKKLLGHGGFKDVYATHEALQTNRKDFYNYVLLKMQKWDGGVINDLVCEMIVSGEPKRTFYLSQSGYSGTRLVMYAPLIKGKSKLSLLKADPRIAASAFVQHFKQLEALHRAGYSHNDVKAENYMFEPNTPDGFGAGTLIDLGDMRRPWQASSVVSQGWTFPSSYTMDKGFSAVYERMLQKELLTKYGQQEEKRQEWLDESFSYAAARKNAGPDRPALPRFGVHADMAAVLKYGISFCGIANERTRPLIEEAVLHMFDPYYMSRVVDEVIQSYDLQSAPCLVLTPLRTANRPVVVFDPPEARINERHLGSVLEGMPDVVVSAGTYGGQVALARFGSEQNGVTEEERQSFEEHFEGVVQRKMNERERRMETGEEVGEEEDEDELKKLEFDGWYRRRYGLGPAPFRQLFRQAGVLLDSEVVKDPSPVTEALSSLLESLRTWLSEESVVVPQLAHTITKIFVVTLVGTDGGNNGVQNHVFRQAYRTLVVPNREVLRDYWDPRVAQTSNADSFFRLVKEKAMQHAHFRDVFSQPRAPAAKLLEQIDSDSTSQVGGPEILWDSGHYRVSDGRYGLSMQVRTGGGRLSSEQMKEAIRREVHERRGQISVSVSKIDQWVNQAFHRFFADSVVDKIETYYKDIEEAFSTAPEQRRPWAAL